MKQPAARLELAAVNSASVTFSGSHWIRSRARELGKLVIKGTKVTMQQPHLTGFTNNSRPYEFYANSAEQDITKPDLMQLREVHAKIELEDKKHSLPHIKLGQLRYENGNAYFSGERSCPFHPRETRRDSTRSLLTCTRARLYCRKARLR